MIREFVKKLITKKIVIMKKVLYFLILGIVFPLNLLAQKQSIQVANATNSIMKVNGINVPAREIVSVSMDVADGIASFRIDEYFVGQEKLGPVNLTRSVERGNRVTIRDFSAEGDQRPNSRRLSTNEATMPPAESVPAIDYAGMKDVTSGDWWAYVTVTPKNSLEGYSIFIPSEPFRGLSLKAGQASSKSITLKTGEILFPVFLVAEEDGSTRTGINYSWALVNKIITEGQEEFEFKAGDIMQANSGKEIRKVLVSKLPFDFIIAEGASRGTVIPANYPTKLELYVGWNILPIQYKDAAGLPTQAILILLVNELRKPMMARGRAGSDQITVNRDNIVITNFGR